MCGSYRRSATVEVRERCESGRIGLTANELTWETGSEGSNPSLSALLAPAGTDVGDWGRPRRCPLWRATASPSTASPSTAAPSIASSVQGTWEIPKSRVELDQRRLAATLGPAPGRLGRDLGLLDGCQLATEPHSMPVYVPGQFCLPHRDSEKEDATVGSLVVSVPPTPACPGSRRSGSPGPIWSPRRRASAAVVSSTGLEAFTRFAHKQRWRPPAWPPKTCSPAGSSSSTGSERWPQLRCHHTCPRRQSMSCAGSWQRRDQDAGGCRPLGAQQTAWSTAEVVVPAARRSAAAACPASRRRAGHRAAHVTAPGPAVAIAAARRLPVSPRPPQRVPSSPRTVRASPSASYTGSSPKRNRSRPVVASIVSFCHDGTATTSPVATSKDWSAT